MANDKKSRLLYWESFSATDSQPDEQENATLGSHGPPGEDLAALRRGIGREPGAVPQMWTFYAHLNRGGIITPELTAEHHALALYGVHQQSERTLVHWLNVPVGQAVAALVSSQRHSAASVKQRFMNAATAQDVLEVAFHLRSLVQLLKTLTPTQGFDYTQLFWDLRGWQDPLLRAKTQRQWGAAFYWNLKPNKNNSTTDKES